MELIINELSLDGQFESIPSFMDNLHSIIRVQKLILATDSKFLRHSNLYERKVTPNLKLYEILTDNSVKTMGQIRVFKKLLRDLMYDPPFWTDTQFHSSNDLYVSEFCTLTHGHSLAEACERERVLFSFPHEKFKDDTLCIEKNGHGIILINITDSITLSKLLWERKELTDAMQYCIYRFDSTKLNFSKLEENYNFEKLNDEEINAFISSFELFSELQWEDIFKSDGLKYKQYNPSSKKKDWFKDSPYKSKGIFKFRTSQKFRCFGYKEGELFYVLRFEVDHKESDNG